MYHLHLSNWYNSNGVICKIGKIAEIYFLYRVNYTAVDGIHSHNWNCFWRLVEYLSAAGWLYSNIHTFIHKKNAISECEKERAGIYIEGNSREKNLNGCIFDWVSGVMMMVLLQQHSTILYLN